MLRLQTLGGLACSTEAGPLSGACAQRKPLGFLVYLALAGDQGVTREKLAGLFWGDHDDARARASLKQMLYLLRRDAGDSRVIEGTTTLRLNPALVSVDVLEFVARCKAGDFDGATSLYAGPFLDGVFLDGSAGLEEWCEEQRARVSGMYARALAGRVDAALAAGDHQASLEPLRRLVETLPLEGKWVALLVRQLELTGELSEALRVAEQYCARIEVELGTAPPADLVATIARLRQERLVSPAFPPAPPGHADTTLAPGEPPPGRPSRAWKRVTTLAAACLMLLLPALALRPRAAQPVSYVPVVLIHDFENLAGPDGSPAWATIFANRVAEALSPRFEIVRDSARQGQLHDGPQDLTISGRYFTAGDTLFVQARLFGHSTWTELDSITDVRTLGRQIDQVADTLVQHVLQTVGRVVDSSRTDWGLAPADSVDAGAWSWFLLADKAYEISHDCPAALGFIDSAVQADPGFALPALYRLRCYIPIPPYQPANLTGLAQVRRHFDRRLAELSPAARAFYRYFSALANRDQDSVLSAARALVRTLPHSSRARSWLVAALLPANHFSEVLEVTRPDLEGSSPHDDEQWYNLWARLQALHLLGRHAEELHLLGTRFVGAPRRLVPPRDLAFLRIRALAALGDSAGARRELLRALQGPDRMITGSFNQVFPEEELRVHGMTRLADTLASLASRDRCNSPESFSTTLPPTDSGLAEYVAGTATSRDSLRVKDVTFLTYVSRDIRWNCLSEAEAKFRTVKPPIPDSLYYQAIRAELAARVGDSATVREVSAWFRDGLNRGRLGGWRPVYLQARLAAVQGDRADALRLLSNAIRLDMPYEASVHTDPLWTGYNEDPTFLALLAR